jgi:hypothetical protein
MCQKFVPSVFLATIRAFWAIGFGKRSLDYQILNRGIIDDIHGIYLAFDETKKFRFLDTLF